MSKHFIYATHIPPDVNLLHFRCAPYRSYAIAMKLKNKKDYPGTLLYDMDDPYHYYRTQEIDGELFFIAGGEDHKTGHEENVLLDEEELHERGILFVKTNRGGDITFHGPEQIVGYPILDLEKFGTDIGKYLRNLEEIIIRTLNDYGILGERSSGETGVWLNPGVVGKERKIAAFGVRCSRWITMHGFAFNINTDLQYFDGIIPCGIKNKQVTSLARELGRNIDLADVKEKIKSHFEEVFEAELKLMEEVAV